MSSRTSFTLRISLVLVAVIGTVLLFVGGPEGTAGRSFHDAWDLGHVLLFGIFAFLLHSVLTERTEWSLLRRGMVLLAGTVLIGGGVELAQSWIGGRNASLYDLYLDMVGCLCGLVIGRNALLRGSVFQVRMLRFMASVLLVASLYPLAVSATDEAVAERQFPVLGDFETPFEASRWTGIARFERSDAFSRSGRHSLKVRLGTETYSGLFLTYAPGNWEGYDHIAFSIYREGSSPAQMGCRIHDAEHIERGRQFDDRFYADIKLETGWNDIVIPLADVRHSPKARQMDMTQVRDFGIFAARLKEPAVIYLDHVRLMKDGSGQ